MRLTKKHYRAMSAVQDGADVFAYDTAMLLREVERWRPSFITITKAQGWYGSGHKQEPYFGAILTEAGLEAVERARR